MRIECEHCKGIVTVDDRDVKSYVSRLAGKTKSEAKAESCRANASRPRPNAKGKPKPRKAKAE